MVMGGGGFRFGIYIGMYAALRQAGKAPDVLLASCGGAIAAAIIHNPDPKRNARGYRQGHVRILVQPALHR
jgi:predicted acylesterase/phospholipase RssA